MLNGRLGKIQSKEFNIMADFCYVNEKEAKDTKNEIIDIIHEVQDIVRDDFTMQYYFVGSCTRNMITYDADSNVGYDFDVNFEVNDPNEEYTAEEIRTKIFDALQEVAPDHGYQKVENSTSVITIKQVDYWSSSIEHSCDFAIVNNCSNGQQQYIRLNKKNYTYSWAYRGKGFPHQSEKIDWLKQNNHWNEVRDLYIEKKNNNDNPNKHSRSIFAETINQLCHKYGFSVE